MHKLLKMFLAAALVLAASVGVVACGDDDDDGGGGGGGGGGEIKIGTVGPDNADPVLYQTLQAYQMYQLAYTALITYAHEEGDAGAELVPGLAEEVPKPTNGGKTYKFQLRDGLEYSDGTPVKASDFENTLKRLLLLGSPWSSFYTVIEGTDEFTNDPSMDGDISGIETNDKTGEITVNLSEPDTKILYAIAEAYAAPTPAAKSPGKSLKQPPPGVGPYVLDITDFQHEFILTKNENFPDLPDVPPAKFDKITGVVSSNVTKMTQDVIDGRLDFMTEDPTGDQLPEVRQKYADRFSEEVNPPNTYYNFLNVTKPPFDKQEAREAFNYATDSRALVRVFGGRLQPGCTFLAPGLAGYNEDFECKYGEPDGPPDIEKAKELVKQSGYEGEHVTFWTNDKDPRPAIADYFVDVLNEIGFDAESKQLDQQVYFSKIGEKSFGSQTGFTDWFQDYPHPGDFIETLLGSRALDAEITFNQGFVSDPELDKKLDELRGEDPEDVADEWATLDDYVVNEKAYVVPYGFEESSSFFSERMDAECSGVHPVYKNDWNQFCLK